MSIKASEISDLIKARIDKFKSATEARNVGTVVSVTDGIVRIHGLADARYGEMLEFSGNIFGLALNLEQDSVGAVVLGDYKGISEGAEVKTTGRILEVPVGPELLGRVVDALGTPIDGKGPVNAKLKSPLERVAPGVIFRQSVSQPVQTGLKAIDAMVPIGRGQRELIIGDRSKAPSPTWCASSKSMAPWATPSSSRLPPRRPRRCSIWRRTAVARWANTSWTTARTP
jgi:F-type H+/Na+-transporting ATPase subunit alpha